jgi:hypothetical protein
MITLVFVAFFALATDPAPAAMPMTSPQVRPLSNVARSILNEAVKRSATIENMLVELRQYRVIVYVDLRQDAMRERGATSVLADTGDWRMLHVSLSDRLDPGTRLATLGHELYHALEIAREISVRDDRTFRKFYERIGFPLGDSSFETEGAIAAEAEVKRDLAHNAKPGTRQ